ncbi:MAG: histidine kinase [Cyanobacteria bacterium RYN_339]|nr:histidine kinase [Cyanobacteria bacterium RYN_339]
MATSARDTRGQRLRLALTALLTGVLALALDRGLAVPVYPGLTIFFGSVPILMLALAGGWRPALIAAGIVGLGMLPAVGLPWAWTAYALEAVVIGLWAARVHPAILVVGFWALVGLPGVALFHLVHPDAGAITLPVVGVKASLQELFCVLLAQNLLLLSFMRGLVRWLDAGLHTPVITLQRFQTSFVGLMLIAVAGSVGLVQSRAIERDERGALERLGRATASLAAADLVTLLQGQAATLAVAGGLWPGLSPTERDVRARAVLEGSHFQLFAWLDPQLRFAGGWAQGGASPTRLTALTLSGAKPRAFNPGPGQRQLLLTVPAAAGHGPMVLLLQPLDGRKKGYLAAGLDLRYLASDLREVLPDAAMRLELHDLDGTVLVSASAVGPPRPDQAAKLPGLRTNRQALVAGAAVAHTPWTMVAVAPSWLLQERVYATFWHALPPLLLLLGLLGAMGMGTLMLLRQELRQVTKSTLQLGRLATEEAVDDPAFEDSFLVEVERLNQVYRRVAASLRTAMRELRARDAELSLGNSKLTTLVEALQGLEKGRGEVMNAISHDIKIPLTAVIGYTELLEEELAGPLTKDQAEYVRNIGENSERVVRLLEDLLDFARLEVGRFPIDAMAVEVGPMLERTCRNLQPLIDEQGLTARVEVAPDLALAWADPHRLDQVLNNLLSNAIKFTPRGGRIWLRAAPDDAGGVIVQVVDTGRGVAAEHLPHLFERFYRVPGAQAPGTGLGLAISQKLVEAMGGRIGVLSEPGHGSTFWFTLPAADELSAVPAPRSQTSAASSHSLPPP